MLFAVAAGFVALGADFLAACFAEGFVTGVDGFAVCVAEFALTFVGAGLLAGAAGLLAVDAPRRRAKLRS